MKDLTKKHLGLLGATLIALAVSGASAKEIRYEYQKGGEKICLSHQKGDVEFYLKGRASPFGNAPRFLVPAPYLTPEKTDDPDRAGIGAWYTPVNELDYNSRIDRRQNPKPGACLETDFRYGLMSLLENEDYKPKGIVAPSCYVGQLSLSLVPNDMAIPFSIKCPLPPRGGACRASYFMGNGWEAQFLVSLDDLPNWEDHLLRVTEFFETKLQICEAE